MAAYVDDVSHRVLTEWGLRLDDKASIALRIEVVAFRVEVLELIAANVTLRAVVIGPDDVIIWEGAVTGDARRFGLARNADNYNEALSDATKEALVSLVTQPEFRSAIIDAPLAVATPGTKSTPGDLLGSLRELQVAGVSTEVLIQFVKQYQALTAFSAKDIVAWKDAGIPEAVMAEALQRAQK